MPRIYRVQDETKEISFVDPYFISTLLAINDIEMGTAADVQKASERYTFPTPATTSRKLRFLAQLGLVEEDRSKGKRTRYKITQKGKELAKIFREALNIE